MLLENCFLSEKETTGKIIEKERVRHCFIRKLQYLINMGQSSSFDLRITELIKDWRPLEHNSSILINCKNQQQLQSILVEIHPSQILHEIAIYNARIHAQHPHVCKIAYFNQVPGANSTQNIQLVVYTDRLLPVREDDWKTQRFSQALQGLLTLTKYYGFFCLSERMLKVNQRGQTKVWISENAAKNHRDLPLTSEQQALAGLAGLAARKNRDVANLLIGCCSFLDALNRLNNTRTKTSSSFNNLSHRTIENLEYGRENSKLYKNVFNFNDHAQPKKLQVVNVEPHPLSSLNSTQKDMIRNFAKTSTPTGRSISQHKNKISRCDEDNLTTKPGFIQKKQKKPKSKNIGQTSFDNFLKHTDSPHHSPLFHRFQTATDLRSHFSTTSPKNANPSATFNSSLFPQKPSANRQNNFVDDSVSRDITIINNNVSHVVNNITHNHSLQTEINNGLWRKFRDARTPEFSEHLKNRSMSPLDRKVKLQAPQFIQNRKKQQVNKSNIKSFYNPPQKSPSIILNSGPFMQNQGLKFNSTYNSNEATEGFKSTQQSFKEKNFGWKSEKKRKDQKLYTFCQTTNNNSTNTKFFKSTFSPTSNANGSRSNQSSGISFFRKPIRTKTTQFNEEQQIKKPPNFYIPLMQNKIFANQSQKAQLNLQKSNNGYINSTPTIPQEISQNLPTTKSISLNVNNKNEPQSTEKVSFKKQLKLQFGSLLGAQIDNHQSKQPCESPETPSETNLQARIQQKKMAFAQLKKQAWEVLKDLF